MMGNSIDLSLSNIWRSWYKFRKGKKGSYELEQFSYYLENNLAELHSDLNNGGYRHGGYRIFIVTDNKKRQISVASIRDRVVHRLLYEYLVPIYDKTFIFDAWSCRKNKGLLGAIERAGRFLNSYPQSFIWRADITKFFNNIDQKILFQILQRKITDLKLLKLLKEVIGSGTREKFFAQRKGIPIGNLTSQIFANIYLNELDRFVTHTIKPQKYMRYGDDFIIITDDLDRLNQVRKEVVKFLAENLRLEINAKNGIIIKAKWGLKFLGVKIFPKGRRLNRRNWQRVKSRLNLQNISSYSGLVKKHDKEKRIKEFNWIILDKLNKI